MKNKEKGGLSFKKFWLPMFLFVVAVIIFYKIVDRLPQIFAAIFSFLSVLGPFIGGLVIAFILYKPAYALESAFLKSKKIFFKKKARGLSVLICYLVLILILTLTLYLLLPRIFESTVTLVQNLPSYYNSAVEYVKNAVGPDGKILGFDVNAFLKGLSINSILGYFDLTAVGKYAGEIASATGKIVNVFLAFVVSVYVLLSRNHLAKVSAKLLSLVFPKERINKIKKFTTRATAIFYSYIYTSSILVSYY